MGNGFSVVLARAFGSGDRKRLSHAVIGTAILAVALAILLTGVSLAFLRPLLRFLGTPAEILPVSDAYMRIILLFSCITVLYNTVSSMLRAIGNSLTPLIALIFGSLVNVALDLLFVGRFHMGVQGAAYATVLARSSSLEGTVDFRTGK